MGSRGFFRATEARAELAYRFQDVLPGAAPGIAQVDSPVASRWVWAPWTVGAGWVSYPRMVRDDGSRRALSVLGLKLERELGQSWRWVGQAATGVGGQAGGYATGHLGLGWWSQPLGDTGLRWGGEATLGAAGGGGVRVDGGLFAQGQLQARMPLSRDWSIQADAGWLRGVRGNWSSPLLGLSLVSSFSRLEGR